VNIECDRIASLRGNWRRGRPTCTCWCKLETDSWDAVNVAKLIRTVIDGAYFNIPLVEALDCQSSIFTRLSAGHVAHE